MCQIGFFDRQLKWDQVSHSSFCYGQLIEPDYDVHRPSLWSGIYRVAHNFSSSYAGRINTVYDMKLSVSSESHGQSTRDYATPENITSALRRDARENTTSALRRDARRSVARHHLCLMKGPPSSTRTAPSAASRSANSSISPDRTSASRHYSKTLRSGIAAVGTGCGEQNGAD